MYFVPMQSLIQKENNQVANEEVIKRRIWEYATTVITLGFLTQIVGLFCYFKFWWLTGSFLPHSTKRKPEFIDYVKDFPSIIYVAGGCGCLALSILFFWYNLTTEERPTYGYYLLVTAVTLILGIVFLFLSWVCPDAISFVAGLAFVPLLFYFVWRLFEL
jgi:hypothetical protein